MSVELDIDTLFRARDYLRWTHDLQCGSQEMPRSRYRCCALVPSTKHRGPRQRAVPVPQCVECWTRRVRDPPASEDPALPASLAWHRQGRCCDAASIKNKYKPDEKPGADSSNNQSLSRRLPDSRTSAIWVRPRSES